MATIIEEALRTGKCHWCEEEISERQAAATGMHPECGVRSVMGSVKCQEGLCARLGGPGCGDDPALSRRDAALASYKYFCEHQGRGVT